MESCSLRVDVFFCAELRRRSESSLNTVRSGNIWPRREDVRYGSILHRNPLPVAVYIKFLPFSSQRVALLYLQMGSQPPLCCFVMTDKATEDFRFFFLFFSQQIIFRLEELSFHTVVFNVGGVEAK